MKKLILIFSIVMFFSCSTDDDAGDVITNEFEQINIILPQTKWKVSNLYTKNADHTQDFESFIFTFNEDGSVQAQTDLFTEQGTWAYKNSSEKGEQLELEFNETSPFEEITDQWKIISLSVSKIELSVPGKTTAETHLLAFSKL